MQEIPKSVLFLAGKAFVSYRKAGGSRTGVLSGFFIGAHAALMDIAILTRDVGRWRTYFPDVTFKDARRHELNYGKAS